MTSLEPPFDTLDPAGMARLIEAAPEQIEAALGVEPWPAIASAPDLLAVGAMGGSAIAADLVAALSAAGRPRPMLTVRDYRWPACVTPASLVLLASYSGQTEETLALDDEASARGIPRVGLTTGGTLAERWGQRVPWRPLPPNMPPRAALYASWVAVTRLLGTLQWIDPPEPAWREAAAALRARRPDWEVGCSETGNEAKRLARELHGRPIVLYAESRLEPLATRWRNQINENAKLLAHSSVVPELNHNEVVGWERPGSAARDAVIVVLRDGLESEPNAARLALTAEFMRRGGVRVVEPQAPAGGPLARAVSLAWLGDFVSFYLAMLNGVDPMPVAALDEFKQRLRERRLAAPGGRV